MDRRTRLLVFATALAGAAGYLYFVTGHTGLAFIAMFTAAWLAIQAVFPRIK